MRTRQINLLAEYLPALRLVPYWAIYKSSITNTINTAHELRAMLKEEGSSIGSDSLPQLRRATQNAGVPTVWSDVPSPR